MNSSNYKNDPELSHEALRAQKYNTIHRDITKKEIKSAKESMAAAYEDIPQELIEKFNFSESDLYKYEFKKYVIHCAIEALSGHLYTFDGFDGSGKTFLSDQLSDPRNIYKNTIINVFSADIPTKKESMMPIWEYYRGFLPGDGKTGICDRSGLNGPFIRKLLGFFPREEMAEEFYETLRELLLEIWYKDNVKMEMFFTYISPETQNFRIGERASNPMQEHRVGEVDKSASKIYYKQVDELRRVRDILKPIDEIKFNIIDMEDKEAGLMQVIKHILHNKDYRKRSMNLDMTPDKPLNEKI